MKLLLDTHIWIWCVSARERIGPGLAAAVASSENELWLSPVSIWEFLLLLERGRLRLHGETEKVIHEALRVLPLKEASLSNEVALELTKVSLDHNDPADRFLVATARIYNLTLVTADERLLGLKGISTLPNQ